MPAPEEKTTIQTQATPGLSPSEVTLDDQVLADTGPVAAPVGRARKPLTHRIREEFEEPAIVIFGHGVLIVFGVLILSVLALLIDHSSISDSAKAVLHRLDEYLMVFAFGLLGLGFIIKIGIVVWGSILRGVGRNNE